MLRLFSFLSQFRNTLLFVGLEIVALVLIIRVNDHQRYIVGDSLFDATNNIQDLGGGISDYVNLKEENRILSDQKASLERELHQMRQKIDLLVGEVYRDSINPAQIDTSQTDSFQYIPALVIKNTTYRAYNYLTINKGSKDGIVSGVGVVSTSGIVGRVIEVAESYSLVQSALNVDFRVSITAMNPETQKTIGTIGFYQWQGKDTDYAHANVTYIPSTVTLEEGFEILTAGNSTVFPPGYAIGKISDLTRDQANGFYDVEVELKTDFNQLRYVYVIKPGSKEILDKLEEGYPTE